MIAPTTPARRFAALRRIILAANPVRLLLAWLILRTALWTLLATLTCANPPLDLVEWLSWGGSWEWGYPKHPPLPAWVADFAARLAPGDVWGVYLVSYLFTAACIGAAWFVARDYLPPRVALLAALALDGLTYLTHEAAEYSNNVVLDAGWAWTIVCAYKAIRAGRMRWWIALGVAVGLSVLVKYTIGILLLALAAYVLIVPAARRCLRTTGPYLAAAIAMALAAPHFVWLINHDFLTLTYAAERSVDTRGAIRHLVNPLVFLLGQVGLLLPVAFVLRPLLRAHATTREAPATAADPKFLHAAVLGPVAILVLMSLATGCLLRQIWGSPLWTFAGVWACMMWCGALTDVDFRTATRRWILIAAAVIGYSVLKPVIEPYATGIPGRHQYPGRVLTAEIDRRWALQFSEPYAIVAGEPWRAGNICCFARHRPILYSSGSMGYLTMEPQHCPWTSDADLNARGGVIVWDHSQLGDAAIGYLRSRFPRVELQTPIELGYQTRANLKPDRIGVAFVPPANE